MKRYTFEIYKEYEHVTIYTIREKGAGHSETDRFLLRFMNEPKFQNAIQRIVYWIRNIGERGVLERYFRPERKAVAIPINGGKLRLYGYRVNDQILILGNGGEKASRKVQDSPDVFPHFNLMNDVAYFFNLKVEKGELTINSKYLEGDLTFYIKEETRRP